MIRIIQLDDETGEVGSIELLEDCKIVLNNLLKDAYDKFDVLALAQKFEVNLQNEADGTEIYGKEDFNFLESVLEDGEVEDKSNYFLMY